MKRIFLMGLLLSLGLFIAGCTSDPNGNAQNKNAGSAEVDKTKYLLVKEPPSAQSVLEVKEKAKDGDAVVIVGRIGGAIKPFTGQAAFTIVDCLGKPCNEIEGDTCETPWDYCCEPGGVAKKMILVKFVDEQGQTLPFDAEKGLDLAPLQTVVIEGKMQRGNGGMVIVASGIFVKAK